MQSMQRTQELLLHHLRSLEGMVCGEGRRLPRPVYPYSDGPSEDFDPYPWYPPWSQAPQQRGHTSFMSSPPPVGRTASEAAGVGVVCDNLRIGVAGVSMA